MVQLSGDVNSGVRAPFVTPLRGSDFTGLDGAKGRTFAIAGDPNAIWVLIDRAGLHKTFDYAYDGTTLTIVDELGNDSLVDLLTFAIP